MNPNPPNPESKTPETDAQYTREIHLYPQSVTLHKVVSADFARSLELSRNQYRECMDKLAAGLNKWHGTLCNDKNCPDKQALSLYTTLTKPKV